MKKSSDASVHLDDLTVTLNPIAYLGWIARTYVCIESTSDRHNSVL